MDNRTSGGKRMARRTCRSRDYHAVRLEIYHFSLIDFHGKVDQSGKIPLINHRIVQSEKSFIFLIVSVNRNSEQRPIVYIISVFEYFF